MIANFSLDGIEKINISDRTTFPYFIEVPNNVGSFASFIQTNIKEINKFIHDYGAILFRGCKNINNATDFAKLVEKFEIPLCESYGDLPKFDMDLNYIHKSTPYPADSVILFHNEASHTNRWPHYQWFCCLEPAKHNGQTPIVDCHKVYTQIPSNIRDKFEKFGLKYIRNFIKGLDVSWQDFFSVNTLQQLQQLCDSDALNLVIKDSGIIQIENKVPAIIQHPENKQNIFFNQLLLHHEFIIESDIREALVEMYTEESLPRRVLFGDNTQIDINTVNMLLDIFVREAVYFDWQQGDILIVDNLRTAHARRSYIGPRKICVALSELINRNEIIPGGIC